VDILTFVLISVRWETFYFNSNSLFCSACGLKNSRAAEQFDSRIDALAGQGWTILEIEENCPQMPQMHTDEVRIARMSETPSVIENVEPAPAKRRLHRSTFVVVGLVLLVGVILNCGGDYEPREKGIEYGWPWVYGAQYLKPVWLIEDRHPKENRWFEPHFVKSVNHIALAGNVMVVSVICLMICSLWEIRIRRINKWYQFTLLDWLTLWLILSISYGWIASHYHDSRLTQQLVQQLPSDEYYFQTPEYIQHTGSDVPSGMLSDQADQTGSVDVYNDWFWETLGIPHRYRPYRTLHAHWRINSRHEDLEVHSHMPDSYFTLLNQFSDLEDARLSLSRMELPKNSPPVFTICNKFTHIHVQNADTFSDESLGGSEKLNSLGLVNTPAFRGHRLSELPNLKTLYLNTTMLDDEGMKEIGNLKHLEKLTILGTANITETGWQELANLESLEELSFTDELKLPSSCHDVLEKLPRLKTVTLSVSKFDREWLLGFSKLPVKKFIEQNGGQVMIIPQAHPIKGHLIILPNEHRILRKAHRDYEIDDGAMPIGVEDYLWIQDWSENR
jgi:hypothetical protein